MCAAAAAVVGPSQLDPVQAMDLCIVYSRIRNLTQQSPRSQELIFWSDPDWPPMPVPTLSSLPCVPVRGRVALDDSSWTYSREPGCSLLRHEHIQACAKSIMDAVGGGRADDNLIQILGRIQTLDLSFCSLTHFPESLLQHMTNLQVLNLSHNAFTEWPAMLTAKTDRDDGTRGPLFPKLRTIIFHNNQLTTLPPELSHLGDSLRSLDVEHNQIHSVSAGVAQLANCTIRLSHNPLRHLPEGHRGYFRGSHVTTDYKTGTYNSLALGAANIWDFFQNKWSHFVSPLSWQQVCLVALPVLVGMTGTVLGWWSYVIPYTLYSLIAFAICVINEPGMFVVPLIFLISVFFITILAGVIANFITPFASLSSFLLTITLFFLKEILATTLALAWITGGILLVLGTLPLAVTVLVVVSAYLFQISYRRREDQLFAPLPEGGVS